MIAVAKIVSPLKKELGAFFATEGHSPADILWYITSGVRLLSTKRPWEFNVTKSVVTLENNFDIAVIQETSETLSVSTVSNPSIRVLKKADFLAYPNTSEQYATVYDTTFSASQAGTYTIIHRVYPNPVTDENGSIDIPQSMEDMLIAYSKYFGYLSVKKNEDAVEAYNQAEILLPPLSQRNTDTTPNVPTLMGTNYTF